MDLFTDIVLLLASAVAVVIIFDRLHLPPIIGFLVAGMLGGPHGFGLVSEVPRVMQISEVGIVLLLFLIGVELSLAQFFRMWRVTIIGGGLQVILTVAFFTTVLVVVGFDLPVALFWGLLTAPSSTAIALKLLTDSAEVDSPHGRTALGIQISQDLLVVPSVMIIPQLAAATSVMDVVGPKALWGILVAVLVVVLARYIVPRALALVVRVRSREIFLFTIIVLCLGAALASARFGMSAALGAFMAGLLISESDYSEQVVSELIPFRDVFFGLFFVSVGMLFDASTALLHPLEIAGVSAALIAGKALIVVAISLLLGLPWRVAVVVGLFLCSVGELAFVLLSEGVKAGLVSSGQYQIFLAATIISMMSKPFLVRLGGRLQRFGELIDASRLKRVTGFETGGDQSSDHVVVAGYGINGRNLVKVLKRQSIPFVIIEMNPVTVQSMRKEGLPIIYGDITRPVILKHAGLERARILVIAISDASATRRAVEAARRTSPGLHIIVRTRYLSEVEPLERLGASEVIPEEFETAIEIFVRVLQKYLLPRTVIEHCVAEIRSDSYGLLRRGPGETRPARALARLLAGVEIEAMQLETESPLVGRSLAEAALRTETGATLLAVRRGGQFIPNPDSSIVLQALDILVLMGTPEQLVTVGALTRRKEH